MSKKEFNCPVNKPIAEHPGDDKEETPKVWRVSETVPRYMVNRTTSHPPKPQPDPLPDSIDDYLLRRLKGEQQDITPLQTLTLIQPGMSGETLKQIAAILPKSALANILETAPGNLNKMYGRKHLSRSQTEAIAQAINIWQEAIALFSHDEKITRSWFDTPLPAIGGIKPIDLIDSFTGRSTIEDLLNQLRYGDYW